MVLLFVFMAGSRPFFLAVLYFGSKYFVHFEIASISVYPPKRVLSL